MWHQSENMVHVSDTHISVQLAHKKNPHKLSWEKIHQKSIAHGERSPNMEVQFILMMTYLSRKKKKKKTPKAKEELSISISLMHIIDIKNFGTKILSLLSSAWPYIIYVKFYFKFVNNLTVQYYCLIQIITLLIGVIALQKYRPIPSLVKIQNIDKNIDL